MPTKTISVSPAVPDKLVVNGVDLLNRDELSESQNKELQRYIDANAHLLGFLDKEKEEINEQDASQRPKYNSYGSYSLDRLPRKSQQSDFEGTEPTNERLSQSLLNRINSPYSDGPDSEYGGSKRKGVSWSDVPYIDEARARSNSPNRLSGDFSSSTLLGDSENYPKSVNGQNPMQQQPPFSDSSNIRTHSPSYSTSDKRRTPYDYNDYQPRQKSSDRPSSRTTSPWSGSWSGGGGSKENLHGPSRPGQGWQGIPKDGLPTYSSLQRDRDDYNRYETNRFREQQSRHSRERDDIRFHGYGDHRVSGVCEPKPAVWTGGELVTDPNLLNKSLKPRRFYYSPIGDGVVAADGVELKRLPPDLTPKLSVIHQKYMEKGDPGKAGLRVYEKTWDEGGGDRDDDKVKRWDSGPQFPDSNGHPDDGKRGPYGLNGDGGDKGPPSGGGPGLNGDGIKNKGKGPSDDGPLGQRGGAKGPYGLGPDLGDGSGKFPLGDDDGDGRAKLGSAAGRPDSAMSIGTDGQPREGWTKTFITNPRELINQYGMETLTTIFDLEDHTPKTTVTIKETITPSSDLHEKDK